MTALIGNPLLLTSAPADDDAYQIEKSIRFNEADSPSLKRNTSLGNRRTWTWSGWVKRSDIGSINRPFFSAGDENDKYFIVKFGADKIAWQIKNDSGSYTMDKSTNAVYRDTSAWYHIVIAIDTTQSDAQERAKLYVNGKYIDGNTDYNNTSSLTQNAEYYVNKNVGHYIGASYYEEFGGYMANVHFIDGLQLTPAAFGKWDAANCWQPKAFALPQFNDGTNWSNLGGGVEANNYEWERCFTGATNPGDGLPNTGPASGEQITWVPNKDIVADHELLIMLWQSFPNGEIFDDDTLVINGENHGLRARFDGRVHNTAKYFSVPSRKIDSTNGLVIKYKGDNNRFTIDHILVDGVCLQDSITDVETRKNVNDGRTWDSTVADGFNGNPGNNYLTTSSDTITVNFSPGIPYNELRFASSSGSGMDTADMQYSINGGTLTNFKGAGFENTVYASGSNTLTSFAMKNTTATNCRWNYLKVDGHHLINGTVDNSFHLKFNDTTTNRNLGYSQVMNTPTGAQPIYGNGAEDSASSSLVLAVPGYDLLDHHHTIKGSGSAKAITVLANATTSSTQSKFYNKAIYLDGTGDYIHTTDSSSDFSFGTGDFTIECWAYWTGSGEDGLFQLSTNSNGTNPGNTNSVSLRMDNNWTAYANDGNHSFSQGATANKWYHIALVRVSGTLKLYVNGIVDSTTVSDTRDYSMTYCAIGANYTSLYPWQGYIQDFRVYKGTAKYTANFTPPTIRHDFTVYNLTAASSSVYRDRMSGEVGESSADLTGSYYYRYLFDGNSSSPYVRASGNHEVRYTETRSGVTDLALRTHYPSANTANGTKFYVNGSLVTPTSKVQNGWTVLPNPGSGNLTSVGFGRDGNDYVYVSGIRINNVELTENFEEDVDSFTDSPTNYTDDSDVIHGNYCTINSLDIADNSGSTTLKQGNLYVEGTSSSGAWHKGRGTFTIPKGDTGKWYYEVEQIAPAAGSIDYNVGWDDPLQHTLFAGGMGDSGKSSWCYKAQSGNKRNEGTNASYGNAWNTASQILGVGYDNGSIYFWINGTIQNSGTAAYTSVSADLCPTYSIYTESNAVGKLSFNFGQRAFKHLPSGYKGYCTQNLDNTFDSETSENNPSKYFGVKTWTGNGGTNNIKSLEFQPDLVWYKRRDASGEHCVFDAVRGVHKGIHTDTTDDEWDVNTTLTAFNSNGFTLGSHGLGNTSGGTFVGWAWDAGTAAATPSDSYDITPDAQWVNATAGFSITKYTGNATNSTVPHGLGDAPDFMIHRMYSENADWQVWHSYFSGTQFMQFNDAAIMTQADMWNSTVPNNNVFYLGNGNGTNKSGADIMMYCWTAIPGYSAFGTFLGNGDANGPVVYTGFKPKYLMIRNTGSSSRWIILDTERHPYNGVNNGAVWAERNDAESVDTENNVDYLSNGFKMRCTNGNANGSGSTYIWAAWAEYPFKTARAV